jgi:hypothetical protein
MGAFAKFQAALFCQVPLAVRSLFSEAAPDKFRKNDLVPQRRVRFFDPARDRHLPPLPHLFDDLIVSGRLFAATS